MLALAGAKGLMLSALGSRSVSPSSASLGARLNRLRIALRKKEGESTERQGSSVH